MMSAPAPEVQSQGDGERLGRAPARAAVWRLRHAAVVLMFFAFSLNSDPGRIFNDTKIDLVLNPRAFLSRAVNLWDPLGSAGQLQNQAYGYLFPMGPFFWLGDAVGLPGWATQRLWWGLLLTVSYTGFVVLSGRLGMARGWARMVAGVAYALWPLVLTVIGRSSVEVWPPALAPWILVPLVGLTARARPWRAAALSGLVILCLGGVNATVNLAAVLPTVVWLATRRLDRETLRLAAWWAGAALLATAWWAVPLIALGRYSPPFLDFIESASFTTSTTALVEVMRGTANWVAYLPDSGSRAGLALLTERIPLVSSLVIAIAGLVGVALRRTTERAWLVCMLFLGVLLVSLGHAGAIEGFFAADVRAALDGALAPLRNVHKFDVLIRLSLTLGLASALTAAGEGRTVAETRVLRPAVALAGAFAVAGTASSFFGLAAAPTRSFIEVPPYWNQAISWLKEHDAQGRTLLLPGSRFAEYYWGYTGDEPIQATDSVAWDVRNAVPLTDPSHVRWLDGIERRIADGRGGADLAPALAEGGVGYVLVRTDLAHGAQAATRPTVVRSALDSSPGLERVATFGPGVGGPGLETLASDEKLSVLAPAIEIYAVAGAPAPATLTPLSDVERVVGGAEYAVQPGGTTSPFIRTADESAADGISGAPVVLTDTPHRREVNPGIGAFGASYTLESSDRLRIEKRVRDYAADDSPGAEATAQTGAGVVLDASSSAGDADSPQFTDPGALPYAAFDASLRSTWRPNPGAQAVGSWIEARFPTAVDLSGAAVLLDQGTAIHQLILTTDQGSTTLDVRDDRVDLPEATSHVLRLTIGDVVDAPNAASAGIRTVSIPDVEITRTLLLPQVPEGASVGEVSLHGDIGRPGCAVAADRTLCAAGLVRVGEDAGGLSRSFELTRASTMDLTVRARPVGTADLGGRVADALDLPVRVEASSQLVPDLAGSAVAAVDGDPQTSWIAATTDVEPALRLAWDEPQQVSALTLHLDDWAAASKPTRARIEVSGRSFDVDIPADGRVTFPPVTTTELTVHLRADPGLDSLDPYRLTRHRMPVGVSEISIEGLGQSARTSVLNSQRAIDFPCGDGPSLIIGSQRVQTSVSTTVGALYRGEVVAAAPCGSGQVALRAGRTEVTSGQPDAWSVAEVTMRSTGAAPTTAGHTIDLQPQDWDKSSRSVALPQRSAAGLLRVRENINVGWRATMDGQTLTPQAVNGWQQGWVVPPGPESVVTLTFTPSTPVRTGMLVGGLLPLLFAAAAFSPLGRRRVLVPGASGGLVPGARSAGLALALGIACLLSVAGWVGIAAATVGVIAPRLLRRRRRFVRGLDRLGARGLELPALVTATCFGVAGLLLAWRPYGSGAYAAGSVPVQLLMVLALTALLASVSTGGSGEPAEASASHGDSAA